MNIAEEMNEWETANRSNIIGWVADWTLKAGFKIVTFSLRDGSTMTFELPI